MGAGAPVGLDAVGCDDGAEDGGVLVGAIEVAAVVFPLVVAFEAVRGAEQLAVVIEVHGVEIILWVVALVGVEVAQFKVIAIERELVVADVDGGLFARPVALVESDESHVFSPC